MDPRLCIKGCGFYGSASNKNLCSKCYDDYIEENMKNHEIDVLESLNSHKPCVFESFANNIIGAAIDNENEKNVKRRCKSCNKKVGLTGFECRCGDLFCGRHRYPEEHACEVNYKEIGRKILTKENPICISDKLQYRA